jgi:hypothetical protein
MWKKYGTAKEATDDDIIRRRKDVICLADKQGKNTQAHSEYVLCDVGT